MKNAFTIIYLISIGSLFAQDKTIQEMNITQIPYVFEGMVVGYNPVKDKDGTYYISYDIYVMSVLNNATKIQDRDTLQMVSVMPLLWEVWDNGEILRGEISHPSINEIGIGMGVGVKGVFVCEKVEDNEFILNSHYAHIEVLKIVILELLMH